MKLRLPPQRGNRGELDMAYVSSIKAVSECAVCRRTLLLGERTTRFSTDGNERVSVCVLCCGAASARGWGEGEHVTC